MDPGSGPPRRSTTRLPRTRGDGPTSEAASPADCGGSPAHAGMDPACRTSSTRRSGLPRTRGDGPQIHVLQLGMEAAPPHTRGWTPVGASRRAWRRGSPAHAGMDRVLSDAPRVGTGLPRTRGDGPRSLESRRRRRAAPPHTRGWTPSSSSSFPSRIGSPAHAGMDPSSNTTGRTATWLPRTRGDGPSTVSVSLCVMLAPPHTRGWTRVEHVFRGRLHGSPAHAGMDPCTPCPRSASDRLPRTRGDGPGLSHQGGTLIAAPPHTRGWTPVPARR